MKVSEVSKEEMKCCADLLNVLKVCDISLKVSQAKMLYEATSWLQSLAQLMLKSDTETTEVVSAPDLSNAKLHRAKK